MADLGYYFFYRFLDFVEAINGLTPVAVATRFLFELGVKYFGVKNYGVYVG